MSSGRADTDGLVLIDLGTDIWFSPSTEQKTANYYARTYGTGNVKGHSRLLLALNADEADIILAAFRPKDTP